MHGENESDAERDQAGHGDGLNADSDDLGENLRGNENSRAGEAVEDPTENTQVQQTVGQSRAAGVEKAFEREFQAEPPARAFRASA